MSASSVADISAAERSGASMRSRSSPRGVAASVISETPSAWKESAGGAVVVPPACCAGAAGRAVGLGRGVARSCESVFASARVCSASDAFAWAVAATLIASEMVDVVVACDDPSSPSDEYDIDEVIEQVSRHAEVNI